MNLIFSADRNWGIGKDGGLLFSAKGDLAYFRKMTIGKTVVLGRRTLESLPDAMPLPDRESIVLTRNEALSAPGAQVAHDLEALFVLLAPVADDEIFVMGGAEVYRALLPYARRAYVTRWEDDKTTLDGDETPELTPPPEAPAPDAFAPDLDNLPSWVLLEESLIHSEGEDEDKLSYRFCIYLNKSPEIWRKDDEA